MKRALQVDRSLWFAMLSLVVMLAVFDLSDIDVWVQDLFFDAQTGRWLVDRDEPVARMIFYVAPVRIIALAGIALLGVAMAPARWLERLRWQRGDVLVALATLASVPFLVGQTKDFTNVFCPSQLRRYGGEEPYVKLLQSYVPNDRPSRRGHCFPAGHASGGFALVGFAWLRRSRRWQLSMLAAAMSVGWVMALYQMFKGAHFLSHTLTTICLAWIVVLVWRRMFRRVPVDGPVREDSLQATSNSTLPG